VVLLIFVDMTTTTLAFEVFFI